MKKTYFTVGPSQAYPKLEQYLNKAIEQDIPSLNHRGAEFKEMFKETVEDLKRLLNIPKTYQIFFVSSALEAMERTILGCAEKSSFHVISGSFGKAWADYALQLNKTVIRQELDTNNSLIDLDIPKEAELICITQNDTSTGVWFDPKQISKLKRKFPEKLVAVDIVSSVPYVDLNFVNCDIVFFSVQKGFGLPAGLAVMIVSPRALKKAEKIKQKGISIGSYHNLLNLSQKALEFQTPETPNVLNIFLLNQVVKDMLKVGIESIRKQTEEKSKLIYSFFENHDKYFPYIKNVKFKSPTTIVIDVKGESEAIRKTLSKQGFIVGAGYGDNKLNHIRIANFPSHTIKNVRELLSYI